jgi:formiminotetrahydrofolate cyclodeaminase
MDDDDEQSSRGTRVRGVNESEREIEDRVATTHPLDEWLDTLAQASGAPGGGAASGVMLAVSAALLRMVAGYNPEEGRAVASAERLVVLRQEALRAAEQDGVRSAELGSAMADPNEGPRRDRAIVVAAIAGAASSIALGRVGASLVDELHTLADITNAALAADLVVAAEALAAGIGGASINLRADLRLADQHGGGAATAGRFAAEAGALRTARDAASAVAEEHSARFGLL